MSSPQEKISFTDTALEKLRKNKELHEGPIGELVKLRQVLETRLFITVLSFWEKDAFSAAGIDETQVVKHFPGVQTEKTSGPAES